MVMPDFESINRNPYLNRIPEEEPDLDLHTLDLLNLSQITENTQGKYKFESEILKAK
jgi:hypothetical protein